MAKNNDKHLKEKAKQLGIDINEIEKEELKFTPPSSEELDADIGKNLDDFDKLLGSLSTTEARKKALWKQIYQNALVDRRNAYVLFGDLYNLVAGDANNHALQAQNLSKYLERMSKANDQLIKLAELVDDETQQMEDANFSDDSLYDRIRQ